MALPLNEGVWALDSTHTTVEFVARHLGVSKVRGRFTGVDGKVSVGETLDDTRVEVTVDMSTVATGNNDRDNHLRSSDFFNVETHPSMTFTSTRVRKSGDDYVLDGELTLNGVTRPLSLDVEFTGVETNPFSQVPQAGFSARGSLSRKDFGITWNVALEAGGLLVSDKVDIQIEAEFIGS